MLEKKILKKLLYLSIACFLIFSVSFLLMPVEALGIIPGLMFWFGLIFAIISQILLELRRRSFFTAHNVDRRTMQKPHCGLLTFFANQYARMMDITFLVALIFSIAIFGITKGFGYICNVCISISVFTFYMHCVLNGRNYFHTTNYDTVLKAVKMNRDRIAN